MVIDPQGPKRLIDDDVNEALGLGNSDTRTHFLQNLIKLETNQKFWFLDVIHILTACKCL